MDHGDPWDWSVDEVVKEICHSNDIWRGRSSAKRPNSVTFETTLRENAVDGATLLTEVDVTVLKNELGLTALGERSSIIYAVEVLRNHSPKYLNHRASVSSRQFQIDEKARTFSPAATPPRTVFLTHERSTTPASANEVVQSTTIQSGLGTSSAISLELATTSARAPLSQLNSPRARSGEIIVEEGGRKRRKLALTSQAFISKGTTSGTVDDSSAYLSSTKLPINEIFFNAQQLRNLTHVSDGGEGDDEDEFGFVRAGEVAAGRKLFVKRRVQHYLQTPPVAVDTSKVVRYPYPDHVVVNGKSRHAVVFTHNDGHVQSSRRDAAMLDRAVSEDENGAHALDLIVEKWAHKEADKVVPLLGDSSDEETESLAEEIAKEQEERSREMQKKSKTIDREAVEQIVEEAISQIEEQWNVRKLPMRERKALALWKKANGRKKSLKLSSARLELERLTTRLQKLKISIYDEVWKEPKEVRKQCDSLEVTVEERLEIIFKIQTWERSLPPPMPTSPRPQPPPRKQVVRHDESEGESLHSDIESLVDDQLEGFIEIDDDEMMLDQRGSAYVPLQSSRNAKEMEHATPIDSGDEIEMNDIEMTDVPHERSVPITPQDSGDERSSPALSDDSVQGDIDRHTVKHGQRREAVTEHDIIDLTSSSPVASSPDLQPVDDGDHIDTGGVALPDVMFNKSPEDATPEEIESWKMDDLDDTSDRRRIMIKLMHSLDPKYRSQVEKLFLREKKRLKDNVESALRSINRGNQQGASKDSKIFLTVARLYMCWIPGSSHSFLFPPQKPQIATALKLKDYDNFHDFMRKIIHVIDQSDDEGTPRKKSRQVIQDLHASSLRRAAHERKAFGEEKQREFKLQLESSGLSEMAEGVVINPGKAADEDFIYINKHIASRLKPHQIEGVQFMWREIVTEDDRTRQGCLLAHTMGLGKTMQAITLLVTIAEASASTNPRVTKQIPESLRGSRTLVLCPATLIDNWKNEFRIWTPPDAVDVVGIPVDIAEHKKLRERIELIEWWYNNQGILLLGYERFRSMVQNKPKGKAKASALNQHDHEIVQKYLCEGPKLIIADEAHKLKNQKSSVGMVSKDFQSVSRIALTGSPLANNLQDYYAMIDWAAPGYLGDLEEFNASYRKPIEEGTYADSSSYEQRRSIKKLAVLKDEIGPKVNRADIMVLQHDLKKKTEFVIKLPLTKCQWQIYAAFVLSTERDGLLGGEKAASMRVFDFMSLLTLLVDHPVIFRDKMRQRTVKAAATTANRALPEPELDLESPDEDINAAELGLATSMMEDQEELFREFTQGMNPMDPCLSYKTAIVKQIVQLSAKIGDKVLIFSHQLKVLDYLEALIRSMEPQISFLRLQGSTPMGDRNKMVHTFNTEKCDVFLISTKAGGLGLNITGANRVILMDFGYNPSWEEQAVGRAYRLGQTKEVYVYHLLTGGTFEDKLHHITVFKRQLAARVVDKKTPRRAAFKPNDMLFRPYDLPREDLRAFHGLDEVFDEVLQSAAGQEIRSVSTTATLHTEIDEKFTEEEDKEVQAMIRDRRLRSTDPEEYKRRKLEEQYRLFRESTQNLQALQNQQAMQALLHPPSTAVPGPAPSKTTPAQAPVAPMVSTMTEPSPAPTTQPAPPTHWSDAAQGLPRQPPPMQSQGIFRFRDRIRSLVPNVLSRPPDSTAPGPN